MQSQNPSSTNQAGAPRRQQQGCTNCGSQALSAGGTGGTQVITLRNRFYTGKIMTAAVLTGEQDYFLSRHRLHNRLLHGWGVVCGLQVIHHQGPRCPDRVVITPGIAIDCEGREIVLEEEISLQVWTADDVKAFQTAQAQAQPAQLPAPAQSGAAGLQPAAAPAQPAAASAQAAAGQKASTQTASPARTEKPNRPGGQGQAGQEERAKRPQFGPFLIVISYAEQEIEQVQALYSETTCDPRALEANRVREVACLSVIPWDAENRKRYASCWPDPDQPPDTHCRKDCDEPVAAVNPLTGEAIPANPIGCLDPVCACLPGVPLAMIYPERSRSDPFVVGPDSIDLSGRQDLQTPPQYLTHIVGINWEHGGVMTLSELRRKRGLRITFDRKLMRRHRRNTGMGINQHTFQVQYHRVADAQYPVLMLYDDRHAPYLDEDRCEAVFPIDPSQFSGRSTLRGAILYISLKCDFILDCHGRPVDGRHIKGKLPSGDGTAGGTFESWFRVVDDEYHERRREHEEEEEEEEEWREHEREEWKEHEEEEEEEWREREAREEDEDEDWRGGPREERRGDRREGPRGDPREERHEERHEEWREGRRGGPREGYREGPREEHREEWREGRYEGGESRREPWRDRREEEPRDRRAEEPRDRREEETRESAFEDRFEQEERREREERERHEQDDRRQWEARERGEGREERGEGREEHPDWDDDDDFPREDDDEEETL